MRRLVLLAAAATAMLAPAAAAHAAPAQRKLAAPVPCQTCRAPLEAVAASPLREADRARDQYRHPVETLAFFDVRPDMKVGEYAPGGEWYSRFLGLYLGREGKLVGLYFDPAAPAFSEKSRAGITRGVAGYAADVARFSGLPAERFAAFSLGAIPQGEAGTFDRILVMRMMHNLLRWNIADSEIKAMRSLLKPGGLIGIEQHRAGADAPFSYADGSKGYLRQADVIKFMEVNGFDFVGASEINANSRDTAQWPDGVWTLPPSFALGDRDRATYAAIGESDRMTLLFRMRD